MKVIVIYCRDISRKLGAGKKRLGHTCLWMTIPGADALATCDTARSPFVPLHRCTVLVERSRVFNEKIVIY